MAQAGGELAAYVKTMIVANGARRVVVVNLPDVGTSPSASADTKDLITGLVAMFNSQLANGLAATDGVLQVDAFAASQDQAARPARYGLRNVTTPACDFSRMVIPSSLVCSTATVVAPDVSRYLFADTVHPTPYGYRLLARTVTAAMRRAGGSAAARGASGRATTRTDAHGRPTRTMIRHDELNRSPELLPPSGASTGAARTGVQAHSCDLNWQARGD